MSFQKLKCLGFFAEFLGLVGSAWAGTWDIAVGDIVHTQTIGHKELSLTLPVNDRGYVRIPFCDAVSLQGKSIEDAEKILTKEFEKQGAKSPKVYVTVSYAPRRVYAIGALASSDGKNADARRGDTVIPTYQTLTVLQALSSLGGVSDAADLNSVFIRRTNKDGKFTHISVPMIRLLSGEGIKDIELMQDDVIVVPRLSEHR